MRSEYLGYCSDYAGLAEAINEGIYLVPKMDRENIRQAIVGPIMAVRCAITAPLVDRLLNEAENEQDALPVLQHALMQMWSKRTDSEPLGLPAYLASGGLSKLLSDHAEAVFAKLSDPEGKKIAESLFRTITRKVANSRRIRWRSNFKSIVDRVGAPRASVAAVIEAFRKEGLLFASDAELTNDTQVDLTHEALARNWERLTKWMDDEARIRKALESLESRALNWEDHHRKHDYLYRGAELTEATESARPRFAELSPLAQKFFNRSRIWRRLWWVALYGFAAILVVATAAITAKFLAAAQVATAEALTKAQTELAQSRQIEANQALALAEKQRQLALQYFDVGLATEQKPTSEIPPDARLEPRVYIHIRSEDQWPKAKTLGADLVKAKFLMPGIQLVSQGPRVTEMRYFRPEDKDIAEQAAKVVSQGLGSRETIPDKYIRGFESATNLRPKHLELWFGPGMPDESAN